MKRPKRGISPEEQARRSAPNGKLAPRLQKDRRKMACPYGRCRMRCNRHCVRAVLEKDGWFLGADGQLYEHKAEGGGEVSATLDKLVAKHPKKLAGWYKDSDGYWINLKRGWQTDHHTEVHAIHETSIAEVRKAVKWVVPCDCPQCFRVHQ